MTVRMPLPKTLRAALERVGARGNATSVYLALDQAHLLSSSTDNSLKYEIFVNLPSTSAVIEAKSRDPAGLRMHHVGSVSAEDLLRAKSVHGQGSLVFDVGALIPSLKASGDWNADALEFHFVDSSAATGARSRLVVRDVRLFFADQTNKENR